MELLLPKKVLPQKKYKHFVFEPHKEKSVEPAKRIDFFYIGNDAARINFLVNSFSGGYALESVSTAISFITRNLEHQMLPEIIIIEEKAGMQELKKLQAFMASNSLLATIPVLLDVSGLTAPELQVYRKMEFIDEVVFLNNCTREDLLAKANFLRKVKSRKDYRSLKTGVKGSVNKHYTFSLVIKRLFDIVASSIALLLLSPVLLVIAILIKLESRGPVFYIAPRAGKGYKIFNFYKFRTMVVDADKKVGQLSHLNQYANKEGDAPVFFKLSNDPRITRVGSFLRNTSLDELPQLLNVLLGDMSLVGNRPLPLYEAATLTTDIHATRFMAPAGITGLWQIKKRGDSNMSVEERITLDIVYARKFSFVYDLWIIANTPTALLQKENV